MKDVHLSLHGKFQSRLKLAMELDRFPKRFGTDELLSHSEIHLIEITGDHVGLSVTDMGNCLGITKGAVTSKGRTAYWAHKH